MRISTRARYALRAMIFIAREGKQGNPIKLSDVACHTDVSHRYLEQVAISLKNSKLLKGVSGKNGGHVLARSADQIKLSEIVKAAIGEINIVDCVLEPESCDKIGECECHDLYCLINNRISDTLNEFTLSDLEQGNIH